MADKHVLPRGKDKWAVFLRVLVNYPEKFLIQSQCKNVKKLDFVFRYHSHRKLPL